MEEEFIGQIFKQNCGDTLKILKSIRKEDNRLYYVCEFINHKYQVVAAKRDIRMGTISNPQIEIDEFWGHEFEQHCGDILKVIKRSEKKQGNIALFECEFQKYPCKVLARKEHILNGQVNNPAILEYQFIGKTFKQHCGDTLKVLKQTSEQSSDKSFRFECCFLSNPDKHFIADKCHILRGEIVNYEYEQKQYPWRYKDLLKKYILENFDNKPTLKEVADKLNISYAYLVKAINEFNLENLVEKFPTVSFTESEIINILKLYYNKEIIQSDWNILDNKYEIDIYLPDLKIGIEYNGNLWHSNDEKFGKSNTNYHQQKSLLAQSKGVKLIHIFEYEWYENKSKIEYLIKSKLGIFDQKIGASKCKVKELDNKTYQDFCNKNHLQGECGARIKLGLLYKDELVQVMSFGSPRFNIDYQYEIIRECSKLGYCIIGGKEKLWSYFKKKYNPESVISYCDFAKFTGSSYLKLGFKQERLNKPGFWWFDNNTKKIYNRTPWKHNEYKDKFYKVYDCGQLVFVWENT